MARASLATAAQTLKVLPQGDEVAIGFLYSGISGEDFESRAETSEDGIRTDHALLRKTGIHSWMR